MTKDEHRKRHMDLHKALEELLIDYLDYAVDEKTYANTSALDLLIWSHKQTLNPTPMKRPKFNQRHKK